MEPVGKIHSIETCGTVDGPGIRYVIFLQGCPMRCKYCHNPDTWNPAKGNEMTVTQLLPDILKYKSYMNYSGGGITASGGEPLLQPEFVTALFRACQKEGIHTTLDTSGFAPLEKVKKLLAFTDLVLLDIKAMLPDTFQDITGVSIKPILKFAKYLEQQNIPMWIRFVLVPGLSDDQENLRQLSAYLAGFRNIQQVDILAFHKMGEYKWTELGYEYQLTQTPPPSLEEVVQAKEVFRAAGLPVS